MNVLIIYAHPNPRSFNRAILDAVETTLRERGHAIRIHDLYQMQCRAVLDGEDLLRNWRGDLPADTRREQDAILWARKLVFIDSKVRMPDGLDAFVHRIVHDIETKRPPRLRDGRWVT